MQHLIYLPKIPEKHAYGNLKLKTDACDVNKIATLWTLPVEYDDKGNRIKPDPNIQPIHFKTGFLESQMHDWTVRSDRLIYSGVARKEGDVWLLLIMKKEH